MNEHQNGINGISQVMVENDTLNKYRKMNSKTVVWISIEITRPVKEEIEWLDYTDAV